MSNKVTEKSVWGEYESGLAFKEGIGLFDTVRNNENFFIGKQWEGVESGGLPTPVFNFLKRVVLHTIAGIASARTKAFAAYQDTGETASEVNAEFDRIFETNGTDALLREMLRNAAVDGDGALFTYWDAERGVTTEVVENTRVFFGNVNERRADRQPYIIISSREQTEKVRRKLRAARSAEPDALRSEPDERGVLPPELDAGDKVTVLLRMWRDETAGTVWCCETVRGAVLREPWDTGLSRYPLVWLPWDAVHDSFHGQALVSGLIPNQIFVNKLFAMSMISLMTTAYPKIVYDRTRVAKWDNRVGAAIPVAGGDVSGVAKIIDPAHISPQIAQFIDKAISYTQTFLGATPAALGDVRPDNTSAIIALQKASSVPNELTRQSLYAAVEELARIYADFMSAYYGVRRGFDFTKLRESGLSLKLDAGASSYWSEIASMNTVDNLFARGAITLEEYLERVPDGYIPGKAEILERLRRGD
ncbi:MAG: hypothetical protein LBS90_00680 [Oscillospiraceae bacterium]|jgi:hypothetical protein|nr:hypothetical protein [Oscillospiraceae bacterium]